MGENGQDGRRSLASRVGLVFGVIGIPLLLAGIAWAGVMAASAMSSETTQGTVVDTEIIEKTKRDRSTSNRNHRSRTTKYENVRITVEYTVDGKKYRYTPAGESNPAPSVGDSVTIHYQPDDPADARLGGAAGIVEWIGPIVCGILGIAFTGIGFYAFRRG